MEWKFWKILNFLKLNLLGIFVFSTYLLSLPFNSISFAFIDLLTFCLAQFSLFSFGSSAQKKPEKNFFTFSIWWSKFIQLFLVVFWCFGYSLATNSTFLSFFSSIKKKLIFFNSSVSLFYLSIYFIRFQSSLILKLHYIFCIPFASI